MGSHIRNNYINNIVSKLKQLEERWGILTEEELEEYHELSEQLQDLEDTFDDEFPDYE